MEYDGESALLEDVKICDICGDAGREELLAVCSKCNDGAEHIYCMSTMLDKVPDSDWMCEDCVHLQGDGFKGLDINKSTGGRVSYLPSVKRPLDNADSSLLPKRRAFGEKDAWLTSRQSSRGLNSKDLGLKRHDALFMGNGSHGRSTRGDALSHVSGQNLPKSHPVLKPTGTLTKSKSFNVSDRRPKVQLLDNNPQNHKFLIETGKTKGCTGTSLKKSLSFRDANSSRSHAFDQKPQIVRPKSPEICDFKRLRHIKEHSSVESTAKTELKKPQICLADRGSLVSASSCDKKFASHCEAIPPLFSAHNSRKSDSVGEAEKHCSRPADIIQDLPSSTRSDSCQDLKHKGMSCPSLMSRRHVSGSGEIGQGLPTSENSSSNNQTAPKASDFSWSCVCKSGGSGIACCCTSKTVGHATYCAPADSSSPSVLAMGRVKDTDESCSADVSFPFCNQLNAIRQLAVPMFDYLWKGEFKIQSTGKLPGVLYRIQAHLSSQASSKIPEVVTKFSDKILLEEVPRMKTWPTQFLNYHPQDYSIGLYFFAEDIRSYADYKSLVQYMIDYDLALKGNFNGIELLIFSSNLLPKKSRCWNKLLFLWGIFKQRKFSNL